MSGSVYAHAHASQTVLASQQCSRAHRPAGDQEVCIVSAWQTLRKGVDHENLPCGDLARQPRWPHRRLRCFLARGFRLPVTCQTPRITGGGAGGRVPRHTAAVNLISFSAEIPPGFLHTSLIHPFQYLDTWIDFLNLEKHVKIIKDDGSRETDEF